MLVTKSTEPSELPPLYAAGLALPANGFLLRISKDDRQEAYFNLHGSSFDYSLGCSSGYAQLLRRGDSHGDLIIERQDCRRSDIGRNQDWTDDQCRRDF
jgi:hypothetical protein